MRSASPSSALPGSEPSGLLAFSRAGRGEGHVLVVDPAGPARPRDLGPGIAPSWSPDGKRLVFVSGEVGRARIFVMNGDGSDRRPLPVPAAAASPSEDWAPAWSPDGDRIAFTRTAGGRSAVYVFDVARGEAREHDAVVTAEPAALAAVLWHGRSLSKALRAKEIAVHGDARAVRRLPALFPAPAPAA